LKLPIQQKPLISGEGEEFEGIHFHMQNEEEF
jgi:hypothetical protein